MKSNDDFTKKNNIVKRDTIVIITDVVIIPAAKLAIFD